MTSHDTSLSTPTISRQLAAWIVDTDLSDLPSEVIEDATWRLVDQTGVCVAGTRDGSTQILLRVANRWRGTEEATVFVYGDRLPGPTVGWINGTIGHGPDYDDMNGRAAIHISSVAVPAAIAAGETFGASGPDTLLAMVLGAEIALRINTGAPPHQFHHRGLHGTGVAGAFAAAAIAAKLLGLDADQTANAIGMAGSRASGLMQGLIDGSWVKRLHPGWAIAGGITCALLAAEGWTGPGEVLEGRMGFFNSLLHGDEATFQLDRIAEDLGSQWLLPGTTFKPWPNGVWNHASMEGLRLIVEREGVRWTDMERVDCFVPPICLPLVCEPREAKLHPTSVYHLKFSLPYSVAMLAVHGSVGVDDYTEEMLADPDVHAFAARVFCHADDSMAPDHFPARVEITAAGGRRFVQDVPAQPGDPDNPMRPDDHRRKFRANVAPTLGEEQTDELLGTLEAAWDAPDVRTLAGLTVPAERGHR